MGESRSSSQAGYDDEEDVMLDGEVLADLNDADAEGYVDSSGDEGEEGQTSGRMALDDDSVHVFEGHSG